MLFRSQCFCCTTLRDVILTDKSFRGCYVNDLYTTICSGVLGHRNQALPLPRVASAAGAFSQHHKEREFLVLGKGCFLFYVVKMGCKLVHLLVNLKMMPVILIKSLKQFVF